LLPLTFSFFLFLPTAVRVVCAIVCISAVGVGSSHPPSLVTSSAGASQPEPHRALNINSSHHYPNYNYYYHHNHQHQQPHPNEHLLLDTASGMKNITASVGRNATFECVFQNLAKDFRVSAHWPRYQT